VEEPVFDEELEEDFEDEDEENLVEEDEEDEDEELDFDDEEEAPAPKKAAKPVKKPKGKDAPKFLDDEDAPKDKKKAKAGDKKKPAGNPFAKREHTRMKSVAVAFKAMKAGVKFTPDTWATKADDAYVKWGYASNVKETRTQVTKAIEYSLELGILADAGNGSYQKV
jgi:hypothetical protein